MKITGNFTGKYEILNVSLRIIYNIPIYRNGKYDQNDTKYIFNFKTIISPIKKINPFIPVTIIGWVNDNHLVFMLPNNNNLIPKLWIIVIKEIIIKI